MKKLCRLVCFMLSIVMVFGMITVGASAVEIAAGSADPNTPVPYIYRNAERTSKKVLMSSKAYYDAVVFSMSGYDRYATIAYNFKGLYTSLTFDAGFVGGDQRDVEMTITADGVVVYNTSMNYEDVAKTYTISLEGVRHLVIGFYAPKAGNEAIKYAMGKIKAEPAGELPEEEVLTSCEGYNELQYLLKQTEVVDGPFEMGGNRYSDGYLMTTYGGGRTAKLCYNFDGKYKKLSFDIGRYATSKISGSVNVKDGLLTIEVDGKAVPEYEELAIGWKNLPIHVELDLTGVKQVTISVNRAAENNHYWAIGDIQIACTPKGHLYDDNVDGTCKMCGVHRETVETRQVVHMFRMYNPNTGEHFYTGSEVERDNLIEAGWKYEGVGFTFPANTGAPVYRLYHEPTGEHLYTMDEEEKDRLMTEGWNYEGIAFNSAYDTEAVQHRLHNPNATVGAYHFTFSVEEKDNLIAAGWEYQGIGWYSCWK